MRLYEEILINLLQGYRIEVTFPELKVDINRLIENRCYAALEEIKRIIHDEALEDAECFMKIEEIISTLEDVGSTCGGRHDYC